jgi:hypothetical protein
MKSLAASVIIFLLCFTARTQAVETDTSSVHPFNKAVLFSAILPGGGQVYNSIIKKKGFRHAIWKVPLIYAGLGATIYTLIENQNSQQSLRAEYTSRLDGIVSNPEWSSYDDQGVLYLYRQYLDQRDLSILAIGAVYLFQILDAGVESHFISFDVSEDLSLRVQPTILGRHTPGINISLNFK